MAFLMGFVIWSATIIAMGFLFGPFGYLFSPIEKGLIFLIGISFASTRAGRWKDDIRKEKEQEKEERNARKD